MTEEDVKQNNKLKFKNNLVFTEPLKEILISMAKDTTVEMNFNFDGLIFKKEGMSPIIMRKEESSFLGFKKYECYIKADNIKQLIDLNTYNSVYTMVGLNKTFKK